MSTEISRRTVEEVKTIETIEFTHRPSEGMSYIKRAEVTRVDGQITNTLGLGVMEVPDAEMEERVPGLLNSINQEFGTIYQERETARIEAEQAAAAAAAAAEAERQAALATAEEPAPTPSQ